MRLSDKRRWVRRVLWRHQLGQVPTVIKTDINSNNTNKTTRPLKTEVLSPPLSYTKLRLLSL